MSSSKIYKMMEIDSCWSGEDSSFPDEAVQIFLDGDVADVPNVSIVIKRMKGKEETVFTLEEWTEIVNFIADQLNEGEGEEEDADSDS